MRDAQTAEREYLDSPKRLHAVRRLQSLVDNPVAAFDAIAAHAAEIARTPIALISLIDKRRQRFIGVHGTTLGSTERDVALCAQVVATNTDLCVTDATKHSAFADNPLVVGSFGLRSYAGTPLMFDGEYIGALCVIDHLPREFDTRCMHLLRSLAATTTSLICAPFAHGEQRADSAPATQSMHEQALNTTDQAVVVTDLDNTITWVNDAAAHMFLPRSPIGNDLQEIVSKPTRTASPQDPHISERIAPLVDHQSAKVVGTIHTFTDISVRETQRRRLEQLVNTEPLTGIANRRSFEAAVLYEIDLFSRGVPDGPVAIGILDLDGFKSVNDQLGHQAGDDTLIEIAHCIEEKVAPYGTLARLGGDEFALLLHDTDLPDALRLADEIRLAIRHVMSHRNDVRQHLDASIGLSILRASDVSPGDVLRRADSACYSAKQAGGGRARTTA